MAGMNDTSGHPARTSMKRRVLAALLKVGLLAPLAVEPCAAQISANATSRSPTSSAYAAHILAGISNHGQTKEQPYVTAGDRTYLIGTQNGDFPDIGQHVPGEMGGLWLPPIKLIDGFEARIAELDADNDIVLPQSVEMVAYPYGSLFRYGEVLDAIEVDRFQFSPDQQPGMIVEYRVKNASNRARRLRLRWSVKTDLRPGWYADHLGTLDGQDVVEWRPNDRVFIARDMNNSWFCVWGAVSSAGARPIERPQPIRTNGRGVTATSEHTVTVGAHATSTLTFVISGSTGSQDDAVRIYHHLAEHPAALLAEKMTRYQSIIDRARIRIPDERLQQVYSWVRLNMEWLVRDVPGVGRGLSGGFMEYPWWFGTETYSLQAATMSGDSDLAQQTLRLLRQHSDKANGNGRIAHEITTDGQVVNPGNTQETAQFVMTVGKVFEWTGDRTFAREMYPAVQKGIDWLRGQMDHKLFPEGYGIMEVYGLNAQLIDVAVYTQQALQAAARIASALNDTDAEVRYGKLASDLREKINQRFWIEPDGTYADFYGSKSHAVSAAEGAIKQIGLRRAAGELTERDQDLIAYYERLKARFSAMPEGDRGWITNKNWVIATPLETGIAPRERAIRLLDKIRREDNGEYGPYLSAVERQSMMTISTGVQAVAEGQYRRIDEAMWYVDRIVQTFNRVSPGSISEMMPDHGCFTIAWTSYGIVVPLIEHVFGIRPDAGNKTILVEPQLPAGWKEVSIEQLPIGTNLISLSLTRAADAVTYELQAKEDGWSFVLKPNGSPDARYFLNGKPTAPSASGIRMTGKKNRLLISSGR
jgi:Bacterial alpha-L-rhamnosidase 6 hairpin glycosidase domain